MSSRPPSAGIGSGASAVRARSDTPEHSRPAAHVSRGAVNLGVVSLAAGAVLEWVAPLWGVLPDWLRVVASANEPMMIGGAVLMIGGILIGRRFRRTVHAAEQASGEAPAD